MEITNLVENGLFTLQEVPHQMAHGSKDCQQDLDNWSLLLKNLKHKSGANHHANTANSPCTSEEDHPAKTSTKNIIYLVILRIILRVLKRSSLRIGKYIHHPWLRSSRSPKTHRVVMNCPAHSGFSMPQPPPPWVQICSTRFRTMKLCLACAGPGDVVGSSLFPPSFTQHVRYIKWRNPHL